MIYIPKICGACSGVNNYLNKIYEIYEQEVNNNSKRVVIYNDNLNNTLIKEEISNLGIEYVYNIKDINKDDIVIIPYHGIRKEDKNYLDKHNIEYYDTTCKLYLDIINKVVDKYNDGYEIYIVGSKENEEVNNILSYIEYNGIILENIVDVVNLKISNKNKYITSIPLVSKNIYEEIVNALKEKDNTNLVVENISCKCSNNILNSSVSNNCKYNFVIKDEYLYEEIRRNKNAYYVDNIKDFIKLIMDTSLSLDDDILITGGINTSLKELLNYKYILTFLLFYKSKCQDIENNELELNKMLVNEENDEIKRFMQDFVSLNSGGKHIRGVLIALGYFLSTENFDSGYLDLATSYELFETSILIHDDIIDNAKIRRGKETIPRKICRRYMDKVKDKQSVLVLANSYGICAGDIGFFLSNKIICDKYKHHQSFSDILECFNNIVINTIKGEVLDVSMPFKEKNNIKNSTFDDILTIYKLKTSLYTIEGPVTLGYLLGNKKIDDNLKEILTLIGITYQIKDDINGIFSKVQEKSNTTDIEEFKQTILYNYVINTDYKDEFLNIYGKKNIKEKDVIEIQNILRESGTLDKVLEYLNDLNYEINEKLDKCDILDIGKDIIKGLCIYIDNL